MNLSQFKKHVAKVNKAYGDAIKAKWEAIEKHEANPTPETALAAARAEKAVIDAYEPMKQAEEQIARIRDIRARRAM